MMDGLRWFPMLDTVGWASGGASDLESISYQQLLVTAGRKSSQWKPYLRW